MTQPIRPMRREYLGLGENPQDEEFGSFLTDNMGKV
jgi:hypothetical protein